MAAFVPPNRRPFAVAPVASMRVSCLDVMVDLLRRTYPVTTGPCVGPGPRSSATWLPPSTTRQWPVTYEAPGLHRNATAAATSAGSALRPTGVVLPCWLSCALWL